MPNIFLFPFIKKEEIAEGTYAFFFKKSEEFNFLPGQYIRIILPHQNPDNRGQTRLFSISSSPLEKDYIRIVTKVIKSSFKKALYNLTPGAKVQFSPPMGSFILKEEDKQERLFLAGGIGITPFLCMLEYANEKKLSIPLTLFVSFSTVEEVIYYKKLQEISQNNLSIKIIYTVTHPEDSKKPWVGETGRISQNLIKKYALDILKPFYYIAGPPAMVDAMRKLVDSMGVANEKIRTENFTGY
ncbi:MAG: FAD-dependent oxidoreductase [Candidatus Levybacteria bacterium]|nr:FAD-dependent oxidoreductase [Candidatus Levybacteria bacterium]